MNKKIVIITGVCTFIAFWSITIVMLAAAMHDSMPTFVIPER